MRPGIENDPFDTASYQTICSPVYPAFPDRDGPDLFNSGGTVSRLNETVDTQSLAV